MSDQMNSPETEQKTTESTKPHTFSEQIEMAGNELVDRVRTLLEEGNVRRLIIRNPEGKVLMELPLTIGVAAGAGLIWFTPVFAALGAMAALLARVSVEIVREIPPSDGDGSL